MLTLDTIHKESLWVAKVGGCRFVGTYDEIEHWYDDEDWRDTDLAAEQPEHLREFYDGYFQYESEHGLTTTTDYYNNVYAKRRVWTEDEIKNLLKSNDKFLVRALLKLYGFQTESEKEAATTIEHNGMGFNAIDSSFLTSVSKFYLSRGYVSEKQVAAVRKRIMKYSGQLTRIANA